MFASAATDTQAATAAVAPSHASMPRLHGLPRALPASVLALGAHLKNKACSGGRHTGVRADAHGDLADPRACAALQASVERLLARARAEGHPIEAIAHDLHPDFFSTCWRLQTVERLGVPAIPVQHHAHVAVVLAEAGLTGANDRPVAGRLWHGK